MNKFISFNTRNDLYRVAIDRIVFFSSDKNYTTVQLSNGKTLVFTLSLQKMQDYLVESLGEDARTFARVGKSYIVNLSYIYHIDHTKHKLVLYTDSPSAEYSLTLSVDALRNLHNLMVRK